MKKALVLLVSIGCQSHAMNNETQKLMAELPYFEQEVPEPAPVINRVDIDRRWNDADQELLSKLLISTINRKKFDLSNGLLRLGAPLAHAYAQEKLNEATMTGDVDTVTFFLDQRPSPQVLNTGLITALDAKQNQVALLFIQAGAFLDASIDEQKVAQYDAQIAAFVAPEAEEPLRAAPSEAEAVLGTISGGVISARELTARISQQVLAKINAWWDLTVTQAQNNE